MCMKQVISPFLQAKYHKDFEVSGLHGVTQGLRGTYLVRPQVAPNHETVGNSTHKGVHQCIMELDRRPGVIVGKFTNVRRSHLVLPPKKGKRILPLKIKIILIIVFFSTCSSWCLLSQWPQPWAQLHASDQHAFTEVNAAEVTTHEYGKYEHGESSFF